MYDREFEANPETKPRQSRRVDERKKETPNTPPHDLSAQPADRHGDHSSPATSAAMLNSVAAAQPARAGQSLLRLQRQYGNRYVQRVLMLAR